MRDYCTGIKFLALTIDCNGVDVAAHKIMYTVDA